MTKNITQKFVYEDNFTKADFFKLYAEAIANVSPFDIFYEQSANIRTRSDNNQHNDYTSGFKIAPFSSSYKDYFALCFNDYPTSTYKCEMGRKNPITKNERIIKLENIGKTLEVEVTGRPGSVRRVKKVLDQLFVNDPMVEKYTNELKRIFLEDTASKN